MEDPGERFASALHGSARAWRQAVDRGLKHLGMSQASWMTIAVAARALQPLSQTELADRLGIEGATMVAMVDRMVKASLLNREPSTTDRRIKHIVVTPAGRRVYEQVAVQAAAVRADLLAGIPPDQLATATAVLEALQRLLDAIS